jgi:signal transduction histidine kinase
MGCWHRLGSVDGTIRTRTVALQNLDMKVGARTPVGDRNGTTASRLAWSLAAASLLIGVATALLVAASWRTVHSLDDVHTIEIVIPISFAIVGGLIASRQPTNPIGWLFLFAGIVSGIPGLVDEYTRYIPVTGPGSVPGGIWLVWLGSWIISLVYPAGAAALILLLFPSGRFVPRWTRIVVWFAVPCVVGQLIIGMFDSTIQLSSRSPLIPNPAAIPAIHAISGGPFAPPVYMAGLAVILVASISPFFRLRRSTGDERQQLKWFAYAVAATVFANVAVVLLSLAVSSPFFDSAATAIITLGFGIALPGSAALAILKYRLYDIDVVISRTLVYGLLAAFITAVYLGVVVGVGALVGTGGRANLLLSLVATALVALAVQPVRSRLQRFANRVAYGRRATPYEVLSSLSSGLADAFGGEELLTRMARVLAEGTGADALRILVRVGNRLQQAAAWPVETPPLEPIPVTGQILPSIPQADRAIPVRHQGQLLGAIGLVKRSGEALKPIEEQLLEDFAGQAGLVLRNAGLTVDLQARVQDLRASRQRLVTAQDEARRRLERNLHDGAQQNLVALKIKLGLAESLARKDPEKAAELIAQLKADTDETLETLRDLARGIYPPLLADQGLVAALEGQARKATVTVSVTANRIDRYTQEIEAAVYFCVLEALQNVQKYAGAKTVAINLDQQDGLLAFDVTDDGTGFDPASARRGAGLQNMQDRLDALGGSFDLSSTPGGGTSLRGSVPVHVEVAEGTGPGLVSQAVN